MTVATAARNISFALCCGAGCQDDISHDLHQALLARDDSLRNFECTLVWVDRDSPYRNRCDLRRLDASLMASVGHEDATHPHTEDVGFAVNHLTEGRFTQVLPNLRLVGQKSVLEADGVPRALQECPIFVALSWWPRELCHGISMRWHNSTVSLSESIASYSISALGAPSGSIILRSQDLRESITLQTIDGIKILERRVNDADGKGHSLVMTANHARVGNAWIPQIFTFERWRGGALAIQVTGAISMCKLGTVTAGDVEIPTLYMPGLARIGQFGDIGEQLLPGGEDVMNRVALQSQIGQRPRIAFSRWLLASGLGCLLGAFMRKLTRSRTYEPSR